MEYLRLLPSNYVCAVASNVWGSVPLHSTSVPAHPSPFRRPPAYAEQVSAESCGPARQVRTSTVSVRPPSSIPSRLSPTTVGPPFPAPRSSPCTGQ